MFETQKFSGLVEPANLPRIVDGLTAVIDRSFQQDGATMTRSEVKRRFDICTEIFRQLRGDLRWGVGRILDHLPRYLRAELNGETWEPEQRTMWLPEDQ